MGFAVSKSPLLAVVLGLHLVHAPVPVWDGDDAVPGMASSAADAQETPADLWDIDLLLLGARPPHDPDSGPFDGSGEYPGGTLFGAPCGVPCDAEARLVLPVGAAVPGAAQRALAGALRRGWSARSDSEQRSFAATFPAPRDWRVRLAVARV